MQVATDANSSPMRRGSPCSAYLSPSIPQPRFTVVRSSVEQRYAAAALGCAGLMTPAVSPSGSRSPEQKPSDGWKNMRNSSLSIA